MALNERGVHVIRKVTGKDEWRVAEIHPLMTLTYEDQKVKLQDGQVYDPSGKALDMDALPEWVMDAISKCTPSALAEVGLKISMKEEMKGA